MTWQEMRKRPLGNFPRVHWRAKPEWYDMIIVIIISRAVAMTLQGCEFSHHHESDDSNWLLSLTTLAVLGVMGFIINKLINMCSAQTKTNVEEDSKVAVQRVPAENNPADKFSKSEANQQSKKISKKKIEKFLEKLTVEILKDSLRKHHRPITGVKEDLVHRVVTTTAEVVVKVD